MRKIVKSMLLVWIMAIVAAGTMPGMTIYANQGNVSVNSGAETVPYSETHQTYYVSSSEGSDANSGLSPSEPWKTLTKVSSVTFHPGDTVLLRRGDTWTGETLYLHGSGSSADWITLSAYGSGGRPVISPYASQAAIPDPDPSSVANNGLLYAIKLDSTAGWKITGLEIANSRSGIVYVNEAAGARDGLWIEDCYIHDITKWPLTPFPAEENRVPELQIMPYSVGIYTFLGYGERLQNVTVRNCTFERTDAPLEIRHADNVTVDSITATDSYREGVIFTGINVDHPGQPEGIFKNSQILRTGSHGMIWGTAGLAFNAVHQFTTDRVEIAFTVSPNSPDGVGIDYEGLNKNVTVQNSYIHDNVKEAVMYYRNPQWSGGVENVNTSLIDNIFANNGTKDDGVHAAFLIHQYNADNGGTISGNTIVKAYRNQPLNMIIERNPQKTDAWPSGGYHISGNVVKLPNGNVIHNAATEFGAVQGGNGWQYRQFDGSAYSDLQWDSVQNKWKANASALYIGEDGQNAADGIDTVRQWTASTAGKIRITGTVQNVASTLDHGVEASIKRNDTVLWGPYPVTDLRGLRHDIELDAAAGDRIQFILHAQGGPSSTDTSWNPTIEEVAQPSEPEEEEEDLPTYTASADYSGTQGGNQWYYQQFDGTAYTDMIWNSDIGLWEGSATFLYVGDNWHHPSVGLDSVRTWEAPEDGMVKITGTAKKRDSALGDGVKVSIWKNGELLWNELVTDFVGSTHDLETAVQAGDRIYFRLNCNIDPSYDLTLWDQTIAYTVSLNKPPVITLAGNNPMYVEAGNPYVEPGYAATDRNGLGLTDQVKVTGYINVNEVGTYNLFYNVADAGHKPAKTVTRTVIVRDTTPPAIEISVPTAGSYGNEGDLLPQYTVSDAGTGVDEAKTILSLDGQPMQKGTTIPLYTLPLWAHTLTVTAYDLEGNRGSASISFRTTTSIQSLSALVARFAQSGWIDNQGIANSLNKKLEHGQLQAFIQEVQAQSGKHVTVEAAGYLLRDAQALN